MAEDLFHEPEVDLICRLGIAEWSEKPVKRFYRIVLGIKRIVVCPAREHEHFLIVKHICASWIQALRIVYLDVLRSALYLRNDGVVRGIDIGKQLVQRFVNVYAHHAGISVISKHTAVLPHSVCLRLFARSRIVNCMKRRKGNPSPKGVAADYNIRAR